VAAVEAHRLRHAGQVSRTAATRFRINLAGLLRQGNASQFVLASDRTWKGELLDADKEFTAFVPLNDAWPPDHPMRTDFGLLKEIIGFHIVRGR